MCVCVCTEERIRTSHPRTPPYRADPSFSVCVGPCPVSVIIGPHYIGTDQSPHVRTSVDNLAESACIRTHVNVPLHGHARAAEKIGRPPGNVQTHLTNYTHESNPFQPDPSPTPVSRFPRKGGRNEYSLGFGRVTARHFMLIGENIVQSVRTRKFMARFDA